MSRKVFIIIGFLLTLSGALITFILSYAVLYGKLYPNTYVGTVAVSGLTKEAALDRIKSELILPSDVAIQIVDGGQNGKFMIPLSTFEARADYEKTVAEAYAVGRSGSKRKDLMTLISSLNSPNQVGLEIVFNDEKLNEQIAVISSQTPLPPEEPKVSILEGEVVFTEGTPGNYIDPEKLKADIVSNLQNANGAVFVVPMEIDPTLSPNEEADFITNAKALANKTLVLKSEDVKFEYRTEALLSFLNPRGGYKFDAASPSLSQLAAAVTRDPQNPVFKFENNRVQEFSPAKDGLEADVPLLEGKISEALDELVNNDTDVIEVDIPVKRTAPEFATSDVNDLGIKELIGVGTSNFRGSIASRVYNVAHAASKLNGVLIKPGEIFSFVNTLGDISALTGYKQAYVIQGNQTVLGDGGGVCQVSTTFFRAALNAGLPIVERHPHSYRVGYYEQDSPPGIDATIFHPTVDIKIKNDTPGHILIQTIADTKNMTLRFEFYGTSDGRVATISKPVVSSVIAPPEDLYIDDPTLPAGQTKQVDYKAWGAKVNFNYKVERDGETIFEKTFYSNYQPWQAKFLRGTGPAL